MKVLQLTDSEYDRLRNALRQVRDANVGNVHNPNIDCEAGELYKLLPKWAKERRWG